jgi:YHS domain-containing protein
MELTPGQVEAQSGYAGRVYSFCSAECKRLFDANPKAYVGGQFDQPQETTTQPSSDEGVPQP